MTPPSEKKDGKWEYFLSSDAWLIREAGNTRPKPIAKVYGPACHTEQIASRIVEAVNLHDSLVKQRNELREAIKNAVDILRDSFGQEPPTPCDDQAVVILESALSNSNHILRQEACHL